jgi:hypothetical protein
LWEDTAEVSQRRRAGDLPRQSQVRVRRRVDGGFPPAREVRDGWAAWHYPLAFLGYIDYSGVVAGPALWTLSFLCQETIPAGCC